MYPTMSMVAKTVKFHHQQPHIYFYYFTMPEEYTYYIYIYIHSQHVGHPAAIQWDSTWISKRPSTG
jgi:hypothetical protein